MKTILILLLSFLVLHADKNETYLDKNTGLTWQNNSDVGVVVKAWMDLNTKGAKLCMFGGDQDSCIDTSGDTAASYCQNLHLDGLDGWRLPTIEELTSLDDTLRIDSQKKKGSFWSSTSALYKGKAREAAYMMIFETQANHIFTRDKNTKMFVRCVKDNQTQK